MSKNLSGIDLSALLGEVNPSNTDSELEVDLLSEDICLLIANVQNYVENLLKLLRNDDPDLNAFLFWFGDRAESVLQRLRDDYEDDICEALAILEPYGIDIDYFLKKA